MMTSYYLRRPSTTHKWIYLINYNEQRSEKGRPKAVPVNTYEKWTYTADELEQMNYEGYEPVEADLL